MDIIGTRPNTSSSSLVPSLKRTGIVLITAYLTLVAGLIGLFAALSGMLAWQMVRSVRQVRLPQLTPPEPEPGFRFVR